MFSLYNIISGLTTDAPTTEDKSVLVQRFATELGWTPSYYLSPSNEADYVNIHLVVEHGLENTAIITFLKTSYSELTENNRRELLNISYNNMVDWHIHVEQNRVLYIYNRFNPIDNIVTEHDFKRDQYDKLRSEAFEKIIGQRPSPNIPALDDSLINTISYWKRNISAELNNEISNESLSLLFNSIIFIRALEDNLSRYNGFENSKLLLESWKTCIDSENFIADVFKTTLRTLNKENIPDYLIDFEGLKVFNAINKQSFSYLLNDFYTNRHNSFFKYDFSIMSMHALSRIYEKYVSLLKLELTSQLTIFPSLPTEEINKAYGAIYTPQYIARFFAKYLKENLSPFEFKKIKVAEPAVGSGIFLRSLLELKCDPRQEGISNELITQAFQDVLGLDIDPNACKAAELSLALLQLVLTNEFPKKLNILSVETLEYLSKNPEQKESYDAVISNPPFISTTGQTEDMRKRISEFMGLGAKGRIDSFIAFIKVGLELLRPGGYGLYVLPHSFLISSSGAMMREELSKNSWIKCIADLSAIPVFENTGIYVVLLIFQKKTQNQIVQPNATIVKCRDFVGKALQDVLRRNFSETDYYSIYEVNQDLFKNKEWHILPNSEILIESKFKKFKPLSHFLNVRQGFVTGNDDIFIIDKEAIPEGEEEIYVRYLQDKKMMRYSLPDSVDKYLFHPFSEDIKLELNEIEDNYPITFKYLMDNKDKLQSKKSFQNENWWRPLRTRQPEHILRSKIITPHLTITPKFSFDSTGKFAVSRSPYLIPKSDNVAEDDLLHFFLAVLNSTPCYWYISNHSHIYKKGYTMVEVKTLQMTPVPDPASVAPNTMKKLLSLVKKRLSSVGLDSLTIENEIDNIMCDLYGLNKDDKSILGI
ncbi:HsdM family class I SAM-dependent methyltransferase [Arcticibacter eurypsychrophilus]|uniref:HsdM family class I SAM-dependent methyltransferase n=1 Tax=Arcticibacter eurypsychrophilus TaxID=1434752 RepID=UPI00084DF464|nr:N-6 DNA methylase [Arcticibacter eurypsychrophilus]